MDTKGIEKALKSSEVKTRAAEFEKEKSPATLSLFNDQTSVPDNSPSFLPVQSTNQVPEERGRGRPKGSTNKSTKEWVDYFLKQVKKSPLMFLGELYAEKTEDLARRMCAKREDALKLQIAAASTVLPYVHQKQPVAVQIENEDLPTINIFTSPTLFQQFNNGSNKVKPEIVIDALADTTPEEISLENNELNDFENGESEK